MTLGLLSIPDAAEYLVSKATLYREISDGALPTVQVRGRRPCVCAGRLRRVAWGQAVGRPVLWFGVRGIGAVVEGRHTSGRATRCAARPLVHTVPTAYQRLRMRLLR